MKEYYTLEEVAQKLRVSNMTIYRYIKTKKLKALKLEKEWRIGSTDLDDFLKTRSNITL
jgi:excisionase family DNA binding protein